MFNDLFSHNTVKFAFDGSKNPFISLNDYVKEGRPAKAVVRGVWINPKSQFGPTGVIVLDDININVPSHVNKDIEVIRSRADLVKGIDDGKCTMVIEQYVDKNGVTRNTVRFADT